MNDAKVHVGDISDVILVGGCSYIPKIRSLVLGLCNKEEPYVGMNPLEAVVCGAVLVGAVASGVSDSVGALDMLTIQTISSKPWNTSSTERITRISICMDIGASNDLRVFAGIVMPGLGKPVHPFLEV
ncbi:hypothetical protein MKX01_013855 [Papaver californicum]|nr:hypothetical protein MKX01_013855 [Papaver californicum]